MNYFLLLFLMLWSCISFTQEKAQFWVEAIIDHNLGVSANYKSGDIVYSAEFSKFYNFCMCDPKYEIDRATIAAEYVVPYASKRTDFTAGLGIGYVWGKINEEEVPFLSPSSEFKSIEVNSMSLVGQANFNYYIFKSVGIGIGGQAILANDYQQAIPQIRILFGSLR